MTNSSEADGAKPSIPMLPRSTGIALTHPRRCIDDLINKPAVLAPHNANGLGFLVLGLVKVQPLAVDFDLYDNISSVGVGVSWNKTRSSSFTVPQESFLPAVICSEKGSADSVHFLFSG